MVYDGENEVRVSKAELEGILARLSQLEKDVAQLCVYIEAQSKKLNLETPPWSGRTFVPQPSPLESRVGMPDFPKRLY